jgi:hypothetical protein
MRDSADVFLALPQRSGRAQACKLLIAFIVIGISFATGYGASRVWPLPIASEPPLPDAAMTRPASPEMKDELEAPAGLSAPARSGSASRELAGTPGPSEEAKTGAPSATSSESPFRPASAEPAGVEPPSKPIRADEPSTSLGHRMNRSAYMYRARFARRTPLARPGTPEFAPNPQPNQPSRDFMSYRSRD